MYCCANLYPGIVLRIGQVNVASFHPTVGSGFVSRHQGMHGHFFHSLLARPLTFHTNLTLFGPMRESSGVASLAIA